MKTISIVNKALSRPLLVFGVHNKWLSINLLISFPLLAASHFKFPAIIIGLLFFVTMHFVTRILTNYDMYLSEIIKQNLRFSLNKFYPAIGTIA